MDVAELLGRAQVSGNIAVVQRGGCSFAAKARRAQSAGAACVLFVNTDEEVSGPAGTCLVCETRRLRTNCDQIATMMQRAPSSDRPCQVFTVGGEAGDDDIRLPVASVCASDGARLLRGGTTVSLRYEWPSNDEDEEDSGSEGGAGTSPPLLRSQRSDSADWNDDGGGGGRPQAMGSALMSQITMQPRLKSGRARTEPGAGGAVGAVRSEPKILRRELSASNSVFELQPKQGQGGGHGARAGGRVARKVGQRAGQLVKQAQPQPRQTRAGASVQHGKVGSKPRRGADKVGACARAQSSRLSPRSEGSAVAGSRSGGTSGSNRETANKTAGSPITFRRSQWDESPTQTSGSDRGGDRGTAARSSSAKSNSAGSPYIFRRSEWDNAVEDVNVAAEPQRSTRSTSKW
jgi:hypothetical protein